MVQVKSGNVSVKDIRELKSVVDRENAAVGIFITLRQPTRPMQEEAIKVGFYQSPISNKKYPKIQIYSIEELLQGKKPDLPQSQLITPYKQAKRIEGKYISKIE